MLIHLLPSSLSFNTAVTAGVSTLNKGINKLPLSLYSPRDLADSRTINYNFKVTLYNAVSASLIYAILYTGLRALCVGFSPIPTLAIMGSMLLLREIIGQSISTTSTHPNDPNVRENQDVVTWFIAKHDQNWKANLIAVGPFPIFKDWLM